MKVSSGEQQSLTNRNRPLTAVRDTHESHRLTNNDGLLFGSSIPAVLEDLLPSRTTPGSARPSSVSVDSCPSPKGSLPVVMARVRLFKWSLETLATTSPVIPKAER